MKIRKNDTVLIIAGKDRGKKAKVIKSMPKNQKVVAECVNLIKKHTRPKRSGEKGQIVTIPAPVHVSNVKLICSKCGKASRVGFKIEGERKYRICKKCGQET